MYMIGHDHGGVEVNALLITFHYCREYDITCRERKFGLCTESYEVGSAGYRQVGQIAVPDRQVFRFPWIDCLEFG
jgi:hypothetical protein